MIELWTCDKIISQKHKMISIPEIIKLEEIAECGSVLVKVGDDIIECTELNQSKNTVSGIGYSTSNIQISAECNSDIKIGDEITVNYFSHATKMLGAIDDYATTINRFNIRAPPDTYIDLIFSDVCTACALKNIEIYGIIIRDPKNCKTLFAVPVCIPGKLQFNIQKAEKRIQPCMFIEDMIQFYSTVACDYYWHTVFK